MFFLLDFDGTFVDTESLKIEALLVFLDSYGVSDLTRRKGDSSAFVIRNELEAFTSEEDIKNAIRIFKRFQVDYIAEKIQERDICFKDTRAFFKKINHLSIPFCIVTSSSRSLFESVVLSAGLDTYIDVTKAITKDDVPVGKEKPCPEPYLLAMKNNIVAPQDCYVLEDSIPGMESGLASGASVFFINRENEALARQFSDVKEIRYLDEMFDLVL